MSNLLVSAVESTLAPHLDEDAAEYVTSLLEDDPTDDDARDAVMALVSGSVEDDDASPTPDEICAQFFRLLDFGTVGGPGDNGDDSNNDNGKIKTGEVPSTPAPTRSSSTTSSADGDVAPFLRRLTESVTLKEKDVTTFASGLSAAPDTVSGLEAAASSSRISEFYANMIDVSENPAAMSERARRKARQKALREAAEEEDRRRAIEEAMAMLEDEEAGGGREGSGGDINDNTELDDLANENARDVHIQDFDLPNLRGGGPDLLSGANLTLAHGRRYGLIGLNGCGKTTLMTCIANRQVNKDGGKGGVPKSMSMLLVRQEIMGNDWSAVETVLKSDARREGVKKFIKYCEAEIDRLENGEAMPGGGAGNETGKDHAPEASAVHDGAITKKTPSKSRQKLREKKKKLAAGKNKAGTGKSANNESTKEAKDEIEKKKLKLTEKLSKAYQKLAQIEEDEGGDPEPRARKVLAGLGFSEEMMNKPTSELSGGWRMRVSLSCALFANPSLLLLDEVSLVRLVSFHVVLSPLQAGHSLIHRFFFFFFSTFIQPTNHLDLEAVLWLEKYLCTKFKGTLVVVSHDRHFLNEVVTDIVHFHRSSLTTYRGDVTNFEAVREEDKQRQIRLYENQEAKKAHLQKYIDLHAQAGENGVKAAMQRKSRMKKLDKIGVMAQEGKKYKASYDGDVEEIEEYHEDDKVELNFPDPGGFDGNVVTLERVTFGYSPDKILLKDVDITVDLRSRIALLGRNGCGKVSEE